MNARDLPGPGDLTNRHHPQSPDYLGDPLDESETTIEQFREWSESFIAAAEAKDERRMEQSRDFVRSLMNELIDCAANLAVQGGVKSADGGAGLDF